MSSLAAWISAGILTMLVARAVWVLRSEAAQEDDGRPRGIPATGIPKSQATILRAWAGAIS